MEVWLPREGVAIVCNFWYDGTGVQGSVNIACKYLCYTNEYTVDCYLVFDSK